MYNVIINTIIRPYFDWLEELFGHLAGEAARNEVSADEIARDYLSDSGRREHFRSLLMSEVCEKVVEFWKENHNVVTSELNSIPGLKARFGGDLGPQLKDHLFARTGVYFDTVVVPDPLLRVATLPEEGDKNRDFYFLKYAIAQIQFKEVYLSDVIPPIAALVGEPLLIEGKGSTDEVFSLARVDSVAIANELYDQKFDSFDEVREFLSKFPSVEEAVKEFARPELFLLNEYVPLDPLSQIEHDKKRTDRDWDTEKLPGEWHGPRRLLHILFGRMSQANDILQAAYMQGAHPLVQAPVSFHWLTLKIRTNQKLLGEQLGLNPNLELIKTNALLAKNLEWLGNVPLHSLIELRTKGRLSEIRALINQGFNAFSNIPLLDIERVSNQIDYNLSVALEQHNEKVDLLNHELKSELAISIPTLLISVVAAFQPAYYTILPSWIIPTASLIGTAKLKDVIMSTSKYFKGRKALDKTPVGILWQAKKGT